MQDLKSLDGSLPQKDSSGVKDSIKEISLNFKKNRRYLGPDPPKDPLGQSYNEFYKLEITRMRKANYARLNLSDDVMEAAIKWIQENLGKGSFTIEDHEDERSALGRHFESSPLGVIRRGSSYTS